MTVETVAPRNVDAATPSTVARVHIHRRDAILRPRHAGYDDREGNGLPAVGRPNSLDHVSSRCLRRIRREWKISSPVNSQHSSVRQDPRVLRVIADRPIRRRAGWPDPLAQRSAAVGRVHELLFDPSRPVWFLPDLAAVPEDVQSPAIDAGRVVNRHTCIIQPTAGYRAAPCVPPVSRTI